VTYDINNCFGFSYHGGTIQKSTDDQQVLKLSAKALNFFPGGVKLKWCDCEMKGCRITGGKVEVMGRGATVVWGYECTGVADGGNWTADAGRTMSNSLISNAPLSDRQSGVTWRRRGALLCARNCDASVQTHSNNNHSAIILINVQNCSLYAS